MSNSNLMKKKLATSVAWLPVLALVAKDVSVAEQLIVGTIDGPPGNAATAEGAPHTSVVRACRRSDQVGVGIGGLQREDVSDTIYATLARVADRLRLGLQGIGSVHATAVGRGCTKSGVIVYLSSWQEVDRTIDTVRDLLANELIEVEVTLQVEAEPTIERRGR